MTRREKLIPLLIAVAVASLGVVWWLAGDRDEATPVSEVVVATPPAIEAPTVAAKRTGAPAGNRAQPNEAGGPDHSDAADAADARVPGDQPGSEPAATAPKSQPGIDFDLPTKAHGVVWLERGETAVLRSQPGGGKLIDRVDARTEFGSPTVFGVVRRSGSWVAVTTPTLPNNERAWLRLDSRELEAGWTRLSVLVDLSERRAELRNGDRVVDSFPITIGAPGTETPTGRFAVTDTFRGNLNPAYGCCALALSANQPNLPSGWLGGSRIAIHGNPGTLGAAISSGCVRADDAKVSELVDRVPLGTPVVIRS